MIPAPLPTMPLSLDPVSAPVTRRAAVIDSLRDGIVTGALEPGAFLRETALAAQLGVSATPVREAMAVLQAEGLVEIEAHRHKRVTPIDLPATRDLLDVQAHLWRLGYVRGLPEVRSGQVRDLRMHVANYRRVLDDAAEIGPVGRLVAIRASHAFHTTVISAAANTELLRVTLDRLALVARFILLRGGGTIGAAGLRLHEDILAAIERGDRDATLAHFDSLAARMIALADPADAPAPSTGD
ncbi:GntR family transcriptional regulator [Novosphingobium lentum]|uniref:GntR family transcriptional regulator n=1 Tax=Novosphingobium lentum TaxID=145287 RepID=UPI000AF7D8C9|nr:GntR family transcriptional regulator [Novosphingobium lentum]